MFVVSRNYRDPSSRYRWLVRKVEEPLSAAIAYKDVNCKGVKFDKSNADEKGFGCRIIAFCEEAVGTDPEPVDGDPMLEEAEVSIFLDYDTFYIEGSNKPVTETSQMFLGRDGAILIPRPAMVEV